ncbi:MAG: sigma-54 dependent transcriptional regulator [Nitrospirota bacterium]|nr:sigma-54 dependent transcriptional regulator [Nitrospirota bacterium]
MQASIFVTDDESAIRNAIVKRLSKRQHRVRGFQSGQELLTALEQEQPDLILLDLRMPGMSGIDVLKHLRTKAPDAVVIILTAYGTVEDAVEAMKLDAYDFLIKTVDLQSVDPVVDRAIEYLALRRRVADEAAHDAAPYAWSGLVASSAAMTDLLNRLRQVAQEPTMPMLLTGEMGTGKEYLAKVIHHNSVGSKGSFVGINCTALSPEQFTREMFGYERGALDGIDEHKRGFLERAETGTVFLDEIGNLDSATQSHLLHVLQDRSFRRIGGTEDRAMNVRIIVATNHNLQEEVSQGRFREDLFLHLTASTVIVPPLRNRLEDILPLTKQFMVKFGVKFGKEGIEIDADAIASLKQYPFPGNVRELQNVIERAMMLCKGKILRASDLACGSAASASERLALPVLSTIPV